MHQCGIGFGPCSDGVVIDQHRILHEQGHLYVVALFGTSSKDTPTSPIVPGHNHPSRPPLMVRNRTNRPSIFSMHRSFYCSRYRIVSYRCKASKQKKSTRNRSQEDTFHHASKRSAKRLKRNGSRRFPSRFRACVREAWT